MEFAHPWLLLLLLLLLPAIAWYVMKQKRAQAALRVSSTEAFDKLPRSYKVYLRHFAFALRIAVMACVIVILARPIKSDSTQHSSTEGVDVMLAIDISGSMLSRDFEPDRLQAAKEVASQFIAQRESDNIGLVIFAGESFTMCPLTTDHAILQNLLKDVECGLLVDGTAIGDGLASAVNRIKDGPAKSKTIVLLTDGTNNSGIVDPITAAQLAAEYGIRVYTVGVGTQGMAPTPMMTPYGIRFYNAPVEIDEDMLTRIAAIGNGAYFRATDEDVLSNVFDEIDKLEKTKLSVSKFVHREEMYHPWAQLAMLLLLIELFLRYTLLRNIP